MGMGVISPTMNGGRVGVALMATFTVGDAAGLAEAPEAAGLDAAPTLDAAACVSPLPEVAVNAKAMAKTSRAAAGSAKRTRRGRLR